MVHNRIFLSHKGDDEEVVQQYYHVLKAMSLRPFMDKFDLAAGPALVRAINEGMASSCAAVFFVTPQFKDETYLSFEIEAAIQQKVTRGKGFEIITLAMAGERGERGTVPGPLKQYIWKEPNTDLEGIRFILEALPRHVFYVQRYLPLQDLVPPTAKEVALVGQNLSGRLGLNESNYSEFLKQLKLLLSRESLKTVVLVMMTPQSLLAIHPEAAKDLRDYSLLRLRNLCNDLPHETRITVAFHPSATLSLLAVDWTDPQRDGGTSIKL